MNGLAVGSTKPPVKAVGLEARRSIGNDSPASSRGSRGASPSGPSMTTSKTATVQVDSACSTPHGFWAEPSAPGVRSLVGGARSTSGMP
jgi:hypothetical protein